MSSAALVGSSLAALYVAFALVRRVCAASMQRRLAAIAAATRAKRRPADAGQAEFDEGSGAVCKANPQKVKPTEIIALTATALLDGFARKKFSSEYVLALPHAARSAGDELCATAQEDAQAAAAACDAERAAGTLRGPLHGLPVSVKESIKEAGFDATRPRRPLRPARRRRRRPRHAARGGRDSSCGRTCRSC